VNPCRALGARFRAIGRWRTDEDRRPAPDAAEAPLRRLPASRVREITTSVRAQSPVIFGYTAYRQYAARQTPEKKVGMQISHAAGQ